MNANKEYYSQLLNVDKVKMNVGNSKMCQSMENFNLLFDTFVFDKS